MTMNRREFNKTTLGAALMLMLSENSLQSVAGMPAKNTKMLTGDWPTLRQNSCLTNFQSCSGVMATAPREAAKISFAKSAALFQTFSMKPDGQVDHAVTIVDGALHCYRLDGRQAWKIHPPGLNFVNITSVSDFDADGRNEIALMAGRPSDPYGAVVIVDSHTGKLIYRYDVEPMSYSWTLHAGSYLPDSKGQQLVMLEQGYPPDAKLGYVAFFDFPNPSQIPRLRWRFNFDVYTCFPSLLTADVNGDGIEELCIETHSHMWIMDPRDGKVDQFVQWSTAPASVRSYGLIRFQDLNGDGRPDFFCIANFSHHQEVLLNDDGKLQLAWCHAWDDSVTTNHIATTWPEPPVADVDGDGKLEMVVSMFNADGEGRWQIRVYDAVTGVVKTTYNDRMAIELTDIDGDGTVEIHSNISTDPTQKSITGVSLLKYAGGSWNELWTMNGVHAFPAAMHHNGVATNLCDKVFVQTAAGVQHMTHENGVYALVDGGPPNPPAVDVSRIPLLVGPTIEAPLVADIDGDGRSEVIHRVGRDITVYRYDHRKTLVPIAKYLSDGAPVVADIDGDGEFELILGTTSPTSTPVVEAVKVGRSSVWKSALPPPHTEGLPYGKAIYFQTGRFTGKAQHDIYVYAGMPTVRSVMLDGKSGDFVWEKGEMTDIERYYAPTVNLASVWDVNGDGADDLVFTCPDYYCVASGPTGEPLVGPIFPPKIFSQPSQGLYTLPVILQKDGGKPDVCLVDGHYFIGAMTIDASPFWFQLPVVGEERAAAEGFMQTQDGHWLMGFGRQNGNFACLNVDTGKVRWEFPLNASASDTGACDINGDGLPEFVFGTSHGDLYALADDNGKPRVVWHKKFADSVGAPVIADVDNDGSSEILVPLGSGELCLLRAKGIV
jgi:outer membrane protein assembly factor BamB